MLVVLVFLLAPDNTSAQTITDQTATKLPVFQLKEFISPSGTKVIGKHVVYLDYPNIPIKGKIALLANFYAEKHDIPFDYFMDIIGCESNWNPVALNPDDVGSPSYGILQFKKLTFYGFGGKNIHSWQEQIEIGAKMIGDGGWRHWRNCHNKAISYAKSR